MTERGVAIVTGGASGIGLAIAKALLGEGWKILIADLAQGPLEAARAQLEPIRAPMPSDASLWTSPTSPA
jgi:NAD(P)-dependent dehydrogenase (short-subunit alcohol dehydrogenase family)